VVCPSSLVENWEKEFAKWVGNASQPKRVVVRKGGNDAVQQIKAFTALKPNLSEVLIVSYDLFRRNVTLLSDIQKVALLVVDEGHRLKSTSGSLTMTALQSMPCDARLCITATPIQNNLSDLYTMVNFVCPGLLGDMTTFRRDFERPISACSNKSCSTGEQRDGARQSQLLDEIVGQVMLRRLQKDVLSNILPTKSTFLLFCRPSKEQCKLYKKIATGHRDARSELSGTGASPDALTALMGLRKVCAHPGLLDANGIKEHIDITLSGKLMVLDALLEKIRETDPTDKVVIVSNFTSTLEVVEKVILKPKQLNYLRLDGSTNSANRQSLVDTFNRTSAERSFALTLSSRAGGCGLNLIGANRLVMVDPDW
jgi:DNA repair and recombination protein RAD54 and RAD54-like protein